MAPNQPSFGNLRNNLRNPQAAKANLRQGRLANTQLGVGIQNKGGQVFDAMMAVNESQNQVIGQVLEGPVSQRTQRRLAQLQAMSERDPKLANLAQLNKIPANNSASLAEVEINIESNIDPQIGAQSTGARIWGNLQGGRTVRRGLDTGKVFSPAQLSSFRKKNGLARVLYQAPASEAGLDQAAKTGSGQASSLVEAVAALEKAPLSSGRPPSASKKWGAEKDRLAEATQSEINSGQNHEKIDAIINNVAEAIGLDPSLIKAVVKTESNFNQKAVSRAGAQGLMQLMPGTAKEMGVEDPFNPLDNVWGGARYLKKMLDRQGGDLNQALAAYNWGPGNLARHGADRLPGETRKYIEAVNRNYARFKKESQMA
ncbi:MAG: lytic transglycosylase domain-containing protein [Deltaproteobacteria bacterium]|jgi:soluble lytic murein transglycosylase-like protein|nr:lytic transglycosylase domain-containing protein [Deltaproteobacteria bacterium]